MTIADLVLLICVYTSGIALATPMQQAKKCAAQPAQIQAAYLREAKFILGQK